MSAAAANSIATTLTQAATANVRPTRKSIWPLPGRPQHQIFRKLAGNVGESAASVRLISDKVNKCCRSSLERRINPKAALRRSGWADRARPEIDAICAAAIALFQHLA